jgi:ABC-type transport system involved in multi-copper enzyme maturation permease subunit
MKLPAIIEDTFREALARKTIIAFAAISTLFLVIALLVAIFTPGGGITLPQPNEGGVALSPEQLAWSIEAGLAGFLHFIALLLAIFATASIIPNTMDKGAIDLLLSKPVSRFEIIHGKFIGGTLMVLINVSYYVIGMWLIVSIKTGYWNAQFLLVIPVVTFSFIVLYSLVMVIGVASRSSALAIIVSYGYLYLISPLLFLHEKGAFPFIQSETLDTIITTVYYILPKPNDFSAIAEQLVLHQEAAMMPLWSSAIFAAAMYGLALYLFKRKDF